MAQTFAVEERAAAQQIPAYLAQMVNGLQPVASAAQGPPSASFKAAKIDGLNDVLLTAERVLGLATAAGGKTTQAADKAKAWSLVGAVLAIVVAIIVAIIAVVASIFTFDAGASTVSAVVAAEAAIITAVVTIIQGFMNVAALTGHPLAAGFSTATNQIAMAFRKFASAPRKDPQAAAGAMRDILQAVLQIETLTIAAAALPGPCSGDPQAIFGCCGAIGPLLSNLGRLVQGAQLLNVDDARSAFRALQHAQVSVTAASYPH